MTILKLLTTAVLALVAGWLVEAAKADEAYLCEANRIVYVKPGQLEHLKKTDACIAGYFGLKVEQAGAGGIPQPATAAAAATAAPVLAAPAPPRDAVRIINAQESGRWFKPVR